MSYLVFARKYRPETFKDVLGQDHVVKTLANAIAKDRLAHAYLFVGPRGTGKTTTARIFAKALNCSDGPSIDFDPSEDICTEIAEGRSLDVLEIDGASNNGVEQVRELRETVRFAPAKCRFKIIYIDEVHMLSSAAFNALLKTLEEPPPHVKFIFATTEAHKILPTIISRCQRFDLRPIPTDIIAEHLINVGKQEDVSIDKEAAWAIAKGADGGMRDALSMLDQLVAFCGNTISSEHVREIFGFTSGETVHLILSSVFKKDNVSGLQAIQEQNSLGKDLSQLLGELIQTVRALLIAKVQEDVIAPGLPDNLWEELKELTANYKPERLLATLDLLVDSAAKIRWSSDKALHLEIALIRAIQTLGEVSLTDLISTLGKLPADTPLGNSTPPKTDLPTTPEPTVKAAVAPEPKAEEPAPVEPVPEKEPLPPNPLEASSTPERVVRPKRASQEPAKNDIDDRLNRLMESAPEKSPEPEPIPEPKKKPAENKKSESPSHAENMKKAQEDFHNDPLIKDALEMFEGTLVS